MNLESPRLTSPADPHSLHRPLAGDGYLRWRVDACLALRGGAAACHACAVACPVRSLAVSADGPQLRAPCEHCGRCAAACPSGALRADGFQTAPMETPGATSLATPRPTLDIDCSRAEPAPAGAGLRVPCLGGVSVVQLLSWWLATGDAVLRLFDHGWCNACPVGGGAFAAGDAVRQANAWLADCGVASGRLVQVVRQPAAPARAYRPVAVAAPPLSRRAFLRRVSSEPATRERDAAPPDGPRAPRRREPAPLPARDTLLRLLQTIAERQARALPARALPSLSVSARCADDGVCAASCPTGALVRREDDDALTLHFDAARCVACARCESVCAHAALQLGHGGTAGFAIVHQRLRRDCLQCGATVTGSTLAALCPRCAGHRHLGGAMFGTRVADSLMQSNRLSPDHEEPSNERPDFR